LKRHTIITDVTRMSSPRVCVFGYWMDLTPVRPTLAGRAAITEALLTRQARAPVRPFSIVELDFVAPNAHAPHTEDWTVEPHHWQLVTGRIADEDAEMLLQHVLDPDVAAIFGTSIFTDHGWYVLQGEGHRSIGTVRPSSICSVLYGVSPHDASWDYRITFEDQSGARYRLRVTDLAFRRYCNDGRLKGEPPEVVSAALHRLLQQAEVYLRIGLARGRARYPDRCYLQITGVHTFPDYLGGRCFADLPTIVS